jgi:2,3-bisphosphoglycerate-independent phosphoglycerate mutase
MFSLLKSTKHPKIKPMVLLILDGWGIAPASAGNAITSARTPNFDKFYKLYPHTELIAAGESVGLPANEVGSSDVGHLTIGAGRVIYQSLPRINMAIEDGTFFENEAFVAAVNHIKIHNSRLHLMGLVSTGEVHSSLAHFYALLEFCKRSNLNGVSMHLFTDGRDAPPQDGINVIDEIERRLEVLDVGHISTISGRYYAMDRDGRWERTQKAYEAIVSGRGVTSKSASEAVKAAYRRGQTDEFIEPTLIVPETLSARLGPVSVKKLSTVEDNDAIIFFNFRVDRPRQLTLAFVHPDFENLKGVELGYIPYEARTERKLQKQRVTGPTFRRIKKSDKLFFVTMTEYQKNLSVSAVAFSPERVEECLPDIFSKKSLRQIHMAESEKERMVTFYFGGLRESRFAGEEVVIIPSPKVATYDKKPEMSVFKLVKRFKKELTKGVYHFFILNFANADMVAHSGSMPATIAAIEAVDKATGVVVSAVLEREGTVVITADHGNAEELLTLSTTSFFFTSEQGSTNTEHSNNPVPIMVIGKAYEGRPTTLSKGTLADVAPTILGMMGIPVPEAMSGRNLLSKSSNDQAPNNKHSK